VSDPNPATIFAFHIHAEGVVTSTNGEPVPDNTTTEEEVSP